MTRNPCLWASTLALYSVGFSVQASGSPQLKGPAEGSLDPQSYDRRWSSLEEEIPAWLTERRVIGDNNLETIIASQDTESFSPSRSVARVETRDGKGYCTAARVGKDLFLTNFHCYEFVDCQNVQFHLGYEKNLPEADQRIFHCTEALAFNEHFDYALYRAEGVSSLQPEKRSEKDVLEHENLGDLAEFPAATLWIGDLSVNQPLLVASHPGARLKEVDRSEECRLLSIKTQIFLGRETLTHACDTEGGSSGSPVFDRKSGRVVALHWGGTDEFNMAVPISLIVQDWRSILSADILAEMRIEK